MLHYTTLAFYSVHKFYNVSLFRTVLFQAHICFPIQSGHAPRSIKTHCTPHVYYVTSGSAFEAAFIFQLVQSPFICMQRR